MLTPLAAVAAFGSAVIVFDLKFTGIRRGGHVEADLVLLSGLRGHAGFYIELGAPDTAHVRGPGCSDGKGRRTAGSACALLKTVPDLAGCGEGQRFGDIGCGNRLAAAAAGDGVSKSAQIQLLVLCADLLDLDVTDGDRAARRAVAKLEDQHQLSAAGGRRGEIGGADARAGQAPLAAVEIRSFAVSNQHLVLSRAPRSSQLRADPILLSGLRGHAGMDQQLGAPDAAFAARRGDVQRCGTAGSRYGLLQSVIVFFCHVAGRSGVIGDLNDLLILGRQLFQAEIRQGDRIARGCIRLPHLQAQGQRTVAHIRRQGKFHVIRAPCGQTAAVQRAVGVLIVSVKAGLVLGLGIFRFQIKGDPIGHAGLQRHTRSGIELGLPDAPVARILRRLGNDQRRAGGALLQAHHIAVVMPLGDGIRTAVGKVGQRDIGISLGDQLSGHLAGRDHLIQRKTCRQRIAVPVLDRLHADVADADLCVLRGLAQGKLQDQLLGLEALLGHRDDLFHGLGRACVQMLAVESSVALLPIRVVVADLKIHRPVGRQIRADAITRPRLQADTGLDIESGLPDLGV